MKKQINKLITVTGLSLALSFSNFKYDIFFSNLSHSSVSAYSPSPLQTIFIKG